MSLIHWVWVSGAALPKIVSVSYPGVRFTSFSPVVPKGAARDLGLTLNFRKVLVVVYHNRGSLLSKCERLISAQQALQITLNWKRLWQGRRDVLLTNLKMDG